MIFIKVVVYWGFIRWENLIQFFLRNIEQTINNSIKSIHHIVYMGEKHFPYPYRIWWRATTSQFLITSGVKPYMNTPSSEGISRLCILIFLWHILFSYWIMYRIDCFDHKIQTQFKNSFILLFFRVPVCFLFPSQLYYVYVSNVYANERLLAWHSCLHLIQFNIFLPIDIAIGF